MQQSACGGAHGIHVTSRLWSETTEIRRQFDNFTTFKGPDRSTRVIFTQSFFWRHARAVEKTSQYARISPCSALVLTRNAVRSVAIARRSKAQIRAPPFHLGCLAMRYRGHSLCIMEIRHLLWGCQDSCFPMGESLYKHEGGRTWTGTARIDSDRELVSLDPNIYNVRRRPRCSGGPVLI